MNFIHNCDSVRLFVCVIKNYKQYAVIIKFVVKLLVDTTTTTTLYQ